MSVFKNEPLISKALYGNDNINWFKMAPYEVFYFSVLSAQFGYEKFEKKKENKF